MIDLRGQILEKLKKPVAILGNGLTGRSLAKMVTHLGGQSCIYGESENDRSLNLEELWQHDLYLHSPGFVLDHPWLQAVRDSGATLLSELDFGAAFWEGKVIAVTGTNGKTTITDFIDQVLSAEGYHSKAVGNIGKPFTDILPIFNDKKEWAVCEVSSFQSEPLEVFSPDYLIWTNLTEDHQDRHGTMERYFDCKWRLVERSRGISFLGEEVFDLAKKLSKKIPDNVQCVTFSDFFEPPEASPFSFSPQKKNFQIASALLLHLGIPKSIICDVATSFRLPKHRLSKVAEIENVCFWNDSKATNFGASIAALSSFGKPVIWIGGGVSKGGNIEKFCQEIQPYIKKAYLIGDTASLLSLHLTELGVPHVSCSTLDEAVELAYEISLSEENVLFSPGFASFDMFENYAKRGEVFNRAVEKIRSLTVKKGR